MTYIELKAELYGSDVEGLSIDQTDTVGLLSNFDQIDQLEDGDLGLVDVESKSVQKAGETRKLGSILVKNAKNIAFALTLLVAGMFTMNFSQWLYYKKVADGTNLFVQLSWYMSQALVGFLPSVDAVKDARFQKDRKAKRRLLKSLKCMCSIEVVCGILIMAGFFKVGASLFQIVSALGIPATALIARIVIKRKLNVVQWIGVAVIVVGFSSETIFPYFIKHPAEAAQLSPKQAMASHDIALGVVMTVAAVLLASGLGVVTEKLIHESANPSPTMICTYGGIYSSLLCLAVQVIFVLPFKYAGIVDLLRSAFGPAGEASREAWSYLALSFGGFCLLTPIHVYQNYSYFILVEAWGVIPMGILSAARSVAIMLVSSKLYCARDANQCFTPEKITSAVIVTFGIFLYNIASLKPSSSKR